MSRQAAGAGTANSFGSFAEPTDDVGADVGAGAGATDAAVGTDAIDDAAAAAAAAAAAGAGAGAIASDAVATSSEVSETVYQADAVLLAARGRARKALLEITPRATIGDCVGHVVEGERVLSLRFESALPGYPGWFWTVTLSREESSQNVNVMEMELLPGPDALRAPEWVPWSVRLAEYHAQQRVRREEAEAAGDEPPEDELAVELGVGDEEFDDDFDELEDEALSDIAGAHDVPLDFDDPVSDLEFDDDSDDESPERDFDLEVLEAEDASGDRDFDLDVDGVDEVEEVDATVGH